MGRGHGWSVPGCGYRLVVLSPAFDPQLLRTAREPIATAALGNEANRHLAESNSDDSMLIERSRAVCAMWFSVLTLAASAVHAGDLKPYPPAQTGQTRTVARVPKLADETSHKIELRVGKVLSVDCNQHWFGGDLQRKIAKGWGFPYYVLEKAGPAASTMMACPGREKRKQFVPVRGDGYLLRYNSKLPMVVYVPQGFEVRYRIWSAGREIGRAAPE